jgi:hypothetical protein
MRRKFPLFSLWQFWVVLFFSLGFFLNVFSTMGIILAVYLIVKHFKLSEPSTEEINSRLIARLLERSLFSVKDVSVLV